MGYYITVERDINLYVEDINPGNGKPILFIHGRPVNHEMYEYQFDQLPKMGYRCIGVDLRGYGKSDRPWTGYTYDRMADDIRAVMAQGLLALRDEDLRSDLPKIHVPTAIFHGVLDQICPFKELAHFIG